MSSLGNEPPSLSESERLTWRTSRWINAERGWTGHLWANRFRSSVLDNDHLWQAVRSVEQNPVRAGLTCRCEDWPWSSAKAHCGLVESSDLLLGPDGPFPGTVTDWSAWVNDRLDEETADRLRRNTATGRPSGSDEFVAALEQTLERELTAPKRGRPRKIAPAPDPTEDLLAK